MESNLKNIDFFIRLFFLAVIAAWCFVLLRPFIDIILWGAILAIATYPLFLWLKARLGGRTNLSGTILILLGILIIVGPVSAIGTVFVSNVQDFADSLAKGTFAVPPPPQGISEWAVIGKPLSKVWQEASTNLGSVLNQFKPQLEQIAKSLLYLAANTSLTILKFLFSIIIAGLLMLNAEGLKLPLTRLFSRLTPTKGAAFVELASSTIRNVTRGIIGVSLLQSLLIGIGLVIAGIPAAALLAILCLVLAIIQVGPGLVVIPVIIYAWSTMSTLYAIPFTIWMVPAMIIDNILKPIFMARGLPVPMVVILIGVLGGTLAHGIVGLFIGPVILSLGYELAKAWVSSGEKTAPVAIATEGEKID